MRFIASAVAAGVLMLGMPAAASAATELLANPGAEQGTQNWHTDCWGTNSGTFSQPGNGHTGSFSFRTDISSYTSGDCKWYPDIVPVTGGKTYQVSDWYQSNATSYFAIYYENASGVGNWMGWDTVEASASWKAHTLKFTMPADAVRAFPVHYLEGTGYLQTDDYSFQEVPPDAGFARPLVTLSFDDSSVSQWTQVFSPTALLSTYGFKGTEYIVTSETDNIAYGYGWLSSQILDASNRGHEMGSHTVTHPHLPTLSVAQIDSELSQSKSSVAASSGKVPTTFAYPYGEYNDTVVAETKKYYDAGARTVDSGYNTKVNLDPYRLKDQNVLNTTTVADVQGWLAEAKAKNYWVIILIHNVDNSGDPYGTTPTLFNQMLAAVRDSGIAVVTAQQALAETTGNNTPPPPSDTTGPAITITRPASNASYARNSIVTASYSCSDPAGVASCAGNVANGSRISTSKKGTYTFTVQARDGLANTSTKSVSYRVK